MGWSVFESLTHPQLCPIHCFWQGICSAPSWSPSLATTGRCGREGQPGSWHRAPSPESPPQLPFSFLSSEVTPIVPGLSIQVLWPSLCPSRSMVARFHLDWLPKWRRMSTTSGLCLRPSLAVSPTAPWPPFHPWAASLCQQGTRPSLLTVPLTRRVPHARGGRLCQTVFPFTGSLWPLPQSTPSIPAVMRPQPKGHLGLLFLTGQQGNPQS